MKNSGWVGTKEAAALLNVSQRTIQKWIDEGKIISTKTLGGHRRIRRENLFEVLAQENQPSSGHRDGQLVVVLVEDDVFTRRLCELGFQAFATPYLLYSASNGYEGLRLIGKYQPDLLITDLSMPGIDGFEMIRELQAASEYKQLRIVVITSMDSEQIRHQGGLPDLVTILHKPIPFEILNDIFAQKAATLGLSVNNPLTGQ